MTTLTQAINSESTTTENGMPTYASSLNDLVDLFFSIGAMRGKNVIPAFSKAYASDGDLATRIALWARDVRGGAGERKIYRDILSYMVDKDVTTARKMISKTVEIGRWDDLFVLFGTTLERDVLRAVSTALKAGDSLCAKWCPRQGKDANKIRSYMKMTPKEYRKLLVGLTNVVETKMCAKDWDNIDFGKLPSLASSRYQTAFGRNAPAKYTAYKDSLEKGEAKINAGAVYPYDVIKSVRFGDKKVADAQWKALPNYLEGSKENIMPVVDVSGSMHCPAGGNINVQCIDVAVSLGLYLCERSEGIFKDTFVTFSQRPMLQSVKGSLSDRVVQMNNSDWGMSTNLEAVFSLILDAAVKHKVDPKEMPTMLLILSDMQFNIGVKNPSDKSFDMIERMYANAGYKRPSIVYWNLNSKNGVPVTFNTQGTGLISGFSPAIMSSVLKCDDLKPEKLMLETIMIDRYKL